jgi:hypothetical protein
MFPFLSDEQELDVTAHVFSWSRMMSSSSLSIEAVLEQCAAGRVL